jgi:hypothetical protein
MFFKLKNLIISHWLIIVSAFVFAFLILLPVIIFPFVAGAKYQGINIAHYGPDEHYYLAKSREVVDGHGFGNVVLLEGKAEPDPYFSYVEYPLVYPWKFLVLTEKISVVTIYNLYTFFGVVALILVIYTFIFALTRDKRLATLVSVFIVAGYTIITNHSLFPSELNIYLRFPFPLLGSFGFFLYLYFLVKAVKDSKKKASWCAVFTLGFSFYGYFYSWTFSLMVTGVLLFIYLFKREWTQVKKLCFIGGGGFLLGAYNFVSIVKFFSDQDSSIISYTLHSQLSHQPIVNKLALVILLILGFFSWKNKKDQNLIWWWSLLLAVGIILNQQIITGRTIQPEHYYWQFVVPFFIMIPVYIFWFYLKKERTKVLFFWAGMVLFFVSATGGRYFASFSDQQTKEYEQSFYPLIEILHQDSQSRVILAPDNLNGLLFTIYTKHDLFWNSIFAPQGHTSLTTFKNALFVYSYLNKESRSDFRGFYQEQLNNQNHFSYYQYLYKFLEGYQSGFDWVEYNRKFALVDQSLLAKRTGNLEQMYQEYEQVVNGGEGILPLLKKYQVAYLVWDKNNNPEWDLNFLQPHLEELNNSDNIYLYKINYSD